MFDYQESISNTLSQNYEKGKNTLITLPTGTGKSRTVIEAIKKVISKNNGKFVIIAPTRLLVNNLWIKELQKWEMNPRKYNIFSLDGSKTIEERKKFWRYATQYKWNIICTPQTFTNDFYRGFFDIDEFDIVHIDEAHHLFKKDFNKSDINKSYNFLKYRKKPISGTTIRSTNSKVIGTAKIIGAEILDDKRAITQQVDTNIFMINDPLRREFDSIISKLMGYYLYQINKLITEKISLNDIFAGLQNINQVIKNYKIPDDFKDKFKNYCYQIATLDYFRNQCFEDDVNGLKANIDEYHNRNQNSRLIKRINELVDITSRLERKKYEKIIDIVRQESKIHNNILIFTKTRKSAEEISNFLNINSFISGFIHGGIDTDRPDIILEEMIKHKIQVLVMTSMMGGEGLNMQYFKVIIHLTPHSDGFMKTQLKGRIRGGKEYYITYQNTREIDRLNSEDETGEDYAFTALRNKSEMSERLIFKEIGDNTYIIGDNTESGNGYNIEVYFNSKIKTLNDIKDNSSSYGILGQLIVNQYLKNKGLKSIKISDYLSEAPSTLEEDKKNFLLSLCNTAFDIFVPDCNTLYEVKTTFSTKTNLSRWQKELAKKGKILGYRIKKVSVFLNKNGFIISEDEVK